MLFRVLPKIRWKKRNPAHSAGALGRLTDVDGAKFTRSTSDWPSSSRP